MLVMETEHIHRPKNPKQDRNSAGGKKSAVQTFVSLKKQERRKYAVFFYPRLLLLENTAPPSSPSQKDEDPPEHTGRHRESQTHTDLSVCMGREEDL